MQYAVRTTIALVAMLTLALVVAPAAKAADAGTNAGTPIENQATLSYTVGEVGQTDILSDGDGDPDNGPPSMTTFVVDTLADLSIVGTDNTAAAGVGQVLIFEITNDGNGTQAYALEVFTGDNGGDGDDFDMDNLKIYVDDGDGIVEAGGDDPLYTSASGDATRDVAADGTVKVYLIADVPTDQPDSETASYTLEATTLHASTHASAGTVATDDGGSVDDTDTVQVVLIDGDAGAGVGGSSDGAKNGQYLATAVYTVKAAGLTVAKTATVIWDPINDDSNPKAIPGAYIEYSITISNAAGAATANLTGLADPLDTANVTFDALIDEATSTFGSMTYEVDNLTGFRVTDGSGRNPQVSTTYTTADDGPDDGAYYSAPNVSIDFAKVLPADADDSYTAGDLKAGDSVTVTFNVSIN